MKNSKKNHNPRIYDDKTLENMKNYYGIHEYSELLKFIKLYGLQEEDNEEFKYSELKNKQKTNS
ncbi:MAG: hypothetical protein DA328_05015 [Nitrososphaeraceae archaeon]|nr:hypothetical protein [Nitrososphaeraceae archaeon]